MILDLQKIPCFGVAGNFTGHLEQAGEATDFSKINASVGAPKAVFPTYIPSSKEKNNSNLVKTPDFLHIFPFDSQKIIFPKEQENLQIEPECAIIFDVVWENEKIASLKPKFFAASNDCSIRKQGAKKISLKKNWGKSSKGLSENLLKIDSFDENGIINNYRIASFLIRQNKAYVYGENSEIKNYSYIYQKLIDWLLDKFNNQIDEGPTEKIYDYLLECEKPNQIMVSIGATRYSEFGETNFLQSGDFSVVALYPENKYSKEQIMQMVLENSHFEDDVSVLRQKVMEKK